MDQEYGPADAEPAQGPIAFSEQQAAHIIEFQRRFDREHWVGDVIKAAWLVGWVAYTFSKAVIGVYLGPPEQMPH